MKVRVLEDFKNKYSKTVYRQGEIVEFSKKRIKEINSTSHGQLVEIVEEEKEG